MKFSVNKFGLLASFFIGVGLAGCSTNKGALGQGSKAARFLSESPFEMAETINLESQKTTHPGRFRIFFSGNVTGETEPCGCAVNPKGGLDRRLNFIKQATRETPYPYVIVDAGNMMFPNEKIDKSAGSFQRARAELLMKGNGLMNVVAQNVGYLDLTAGLEFLKKSAEQNKVRLISANWVDKNGNLLFEPLITYDVGREKAVIIGLSRGFKNAGTKNARDYSVLDPFVVLQQRLESVPSESPVIVLSDLGADLDREIANKIKRPLIIIGARDLSSMEIPLHEGNSILLQGQLQGQQWGVLEVGWRAQAAGWYNIGVGLHFAELWKKNAGAVSALNDMENSDERAQEIATLGSAYEDMMRFAPGDLQAKQLYDYKLVDMSVEFAKPNELSLLMEKVKKF